MTGAHRLRFALLGSGSQGNALLVAYAGTYILVDCGFPLKEVLLRLARLGVEGGALHAILITHEHGDHANGVALLAREFSLPVWSTAGTRQALPPPARPDAVQTFNCHDTFAIGDLEVRPFPVPHDAREPSQFVFSTGDKRLGLLTDTGRATPHIEACLTGCDALILECNHDREMLFNGDYRPSLKARIGGGLGHLDNAAAGNLLARLDRSRLQHVVAAHLSQKNNTPALAQAALGAALDTDPAWVQVADQDQGLSWRELS